MNQGWFLHQHQVLLANRIVVLEQSSHLLQIVWDVFEVREVADSHQRVDEEEAIVVELPFAPPVLYFPPPNCVNTRFLKFMDPSM